MINSNLSWNKTVYLLEKGLDTAEFRRKVIADNMANVDTPHFKRTQVTFEGQLRRALDSEEYVKKNEVPARITDERHIPFFKSLDYKEVKARPALDYLSRMRNDGNNVDIEHEMSLAAKNQLSYELMSMLINNEFRSLNIVMRAP